MQILPLATKYRCTKNMNYIFLVCDNIFHLEKKEITFGKNCNMQV